MGTRQNKVTKKIKDEWGSLKHFCKKNNINYNTFRVVLYGNGTSTPITDKLIELGYIENVEELNCSIDTAVEKA